MVDLSDGLGSIPPAVVIWCLTAKCGVEALARRRRGEIDDLDDERAKFTACFFRCVSPVDLPDTGGSDDEDTS